MSAYKSFMHNPQTMDLGKNWTYIKGVISSTSPGGEGKHLMLKLDFF